MFQLSVRTTTVGLLSSPFLYLYITSCSVIYVQTEPIIDKLSSNLGETTNLRLLQQFLPNVRHKRDACTGKCKCQDPTKASQAHKGPPQRNVVAYHYHHHYYYCCPSVTDHLHKNPHWKQTASYTHAHARTQPGSSVDCACNTTGSCSCTVQEKCNVNSCAQNQEANVKREPDQNAAFGFGFVLDDPVGKDFLDFISKNFVRKEEAPEQPNVCKGNIAGHNLEDPVCQEFFNFFSKNFMRKPEQQTVAPTQPSTPVPTQARQGRFQENINEFNDMKTMFDTLKNEMKDTLSKTADMAKKMGMPIL